METVEASPVASVDRVQETIENSPGVKLDGFSTPFIETVEASPAASVDGVQEPIELPTKNSPGVKVNPVKEPFIETVENSPIDTGGFFPEQLLGLK